MKDFVCIIRTSEYYSELYPKNIVERMTHISYIESLYNRFVCVMLTFIFKNIYGEMDALYLLTVL